MKKAEVQEVYGRLKDYVGCQRTDIVAPLFHQRLKRLIVELGEVIEK